MESLGSFLYLGSDLEGLQWLTTYPRDQFLT